MRSDLPRLPPASNPPQRSRRTAGAPYVADVVERVRRLVEGTSQPEAAIAAHVGIGVATVHAWKLRRGWRRPADASRSTRKVGLHRAGFTRRVREALTRLDALTEREIDRLGRDAATDAARLCRARALAEATRAARRGGRTR